MAAGFVPVLMPGPTPAAVEAGNRPMSNPLPVRLCEEVASIYGCIFRRHAYIPHLRKWRQTTDRNSTGEFFGQRCI